MLNLPGYKLHQKLYESSRTQVYRGERLSGDRANVILKIPSNEYPPPHIQAGLRREYEIARTMKHEGLVRALGLEKYNYAQMMIMEDVGGESLDKVLGRKKFGTEEFLRVGILVAEALGELHKFNIMHRSIHPGNIVYNEQTEALQIIDFGMAADFSRGRPENEAQAPEDLELGVHYISPEQTGRMNRTVDYRSDFYSLGATFYELLTGHRPFRGDDAAEIMHKHIAKIPPPPAEISEHIPEVLSRLIMKLLEKTAETRYQSAAAIYMDLRRCFEECDARGNIPTFELGGFEFKKKFRIPEKLYGRQGEIGKLMAAYERSERGERILAIIKGPSGIGKTTLVNQIQRPLRERGALLVQVKFEQIKRLGPYESLLQGFSVQVKQILTGDKNSIWAWKQKFKNALGSNGALIARLIPELEIILGKLPIPPELPPAETLNRYKITLRNFILAFTDKSHPLVIFLDDAHWAGSSLAIIDSLLSDLMTRYVYVLAAYREREAEKNELLTRCLENVRKSGTPVIEVKPTLLDLRSTNQLLQDSLSRSDSRTLALASVCLEKTRGNPFFLNRFLNTLYEKKLLVYEPLEAAWNWELSKIQEMEVTDNVVSLMSDWIRRLPENTQDLLKLASCVGIEFDLGMLSRINLTTQRETFEDLREAILEGLIYPLDDYYEYIEYLEDIKVVFKFIHARVRQAAYAMIPEKEKPRLHIKIGRLMLSHFSEVEKEEFLFDIIAQLNRGSELLKNTPDRYTLIELNVRGAARTRAPTGYSFTADYLKKSLELLDEESWAERYDLTLSLHLLILESSYLNGQFKELERIYNIVINHARDAPDRSLAHAIKIQYYMTRNQPVASIETAITVLEELGIKFPRKVGLMDRILSDIRFRYLLRKENEIIGLPEMKDRHHKAIVRILALLGAVAYVTRPDLYGLVMERQLRTIWEYGHSERSSFILVGMGIILSGYRNDIPAGYRYGSLAMDILERYSGPGERLRTEAIFHAMIRPWREPLRDTLESLRGVFEKGGSEGDTEYTSLAIYAYYNHSFWSGKELVELERDAREQLATRGNQIRLIARNFINILLHTTSKLIKETDESFEAGSSYYNVEKMMRLHRRLKDRGALFAYYTNRMWLACMDGRYMEATQSRKEASEYISFVTASINQGIFYFYGTLSLLAGRDTPDEITEWRAVSMGRKLLKNWAAHGPANFRHKYYLVEAEYKRIKGKDQESLKHYDRAINLARKYGYIHEEALANELAGRYWLERRNRETARFYLARARKLYLVWGARRLARRMETKYSSVLMDDRPDLVDEESESVTRLISRTPDTGVLQTSISGGDIQSVDMANVLEASRAMAGEVHLGNLLRTMMNVILINAGAQIGYLILKNEERWTIEARGSNHDSDVEVLKSLPLFEERDGSSTPLVSTAVVNYVSRTGDYVVLNDATREETFAGDEYINTHRPLSLFCAPIVRQGRLLGVIYLENNLTAGAFTRRRIRVLDMLSSQCAVAIENARLYDNLENEVQKRTRELSEAKDLEVRARQEADKLNMFSREIFATRFLNDVIDRIFEFLQSNFHFENIALQFIDQKTNEFYSYREVFPPHFTPEQIKYSENLRIPVGPEGGFSWRAYQTRGPVYFARMPDEIDSEFDRDFRERTGLSSYLVMPLIIKAEVIALINIANYKKEFKLNKREIDSVTRFCSQIAGAIKFSRTLKETELARNSAEEARRESEEARRELEQLNQVARRLNETLSLNEILDWVGGYVKENFDIQSLWLQLVDKEKMELYTHRIISYEKTYHVHKEFFNELRVPLRPESGSLYNTYKSKKIFYVRRVSNLENPLDKNIIERLKLKSFIQVPLLIQGEVIGLINFGYSEKRNLKKNRLKSIARFCEQIAGAIYGSSLFKQAEDSRRIAEEAREELLKEIQMAQKIQESLLPGSLPRLDGVRIGYQYIPMHGVGGDFFDLHYSQDRNQLGFFICDVAGHGVPAAFLASMVKMSLQTWPYSLEEPAHTLARMKYSLKGKLAGQTITACMGAIDLRDGSVLIARAGHPPVLHVKGKDDIEQIAPPGRIIADSDLLELNCKEIRVSMRPGEKMILYTDGLIEVNSPAGEMLGDEGLIDIVNRNQDFPPEKLGQKIRDEIIEFSGNQETQEDDFTLLVIEYTGHETAEGI